MIFFPKELGLVRLFLKVLSIILDCSSDIFGPLIQQLELQSTFLTLGKLLAEIHGNPVSAVCRFRPFKASECSRQKSQHCED